MNNKIDKLHAYLRKQVIILQNFADVDSFWEITLPSRSKAANKKPDNDALLAGNQHQMALLNYEKELLESKLKK
ncbi:MAG: hypothetical protein EOO07_00470 [Chitinophagaceae bacterium]|nr:MAG: hypothetical protein EOO07_00470 [Chitinophagaceae bacterium]